MYPFHHKFINRRRAVNTETGNGIQDALKKEQVTVMALQSDGVLSRE
jgi:soluble P-type ATPase